MTLFQLLSALIALVAVFGFVNAKVLRLPDTVGIMAIALVCSIGVATLGLFRPEVGAWAQGAMSGIDFPTLILSGLLGPLLFAGSLHVDLSALAERKTIILILASAGVVLSTVLVGFGFHYGTAAIGIDLPLILCFVFGALISPTDPLAVLGILRHAGVPAALRTKITGESLFNDGVAVLLFVTLLGVAAGTRQLDATGIAVLLVREVLGGVLFGLLVGYTGFLLMRGIDSDAVEILITLAMPTAGYSLAQELHLSAPIAVVVMGLVVGNHGRVHAISEATRERLFSFWEVTDDLLNLLLFGLVGLELIAVVHTEIAFIESALLAIPIVLLARFVSVGVPISMLRPFRAFEPHTIKIMTWGGLRGAISIALALSLPPGEARDIIVSATYLVAVFSILVQATTLQPVAKRWMGATGELRSPAGT